MSPANDREWESNKPLAWGYLYFAIRWHENMGRTAPGGLFLIIPPELADHARLTLAEIAAHQGNSTRRAWALLSADVIIDPTLPPDTWYICPARYREEFAGDSTMIGGDPWLTGDEPKLGGDRRIVVGVQPTAGFDLGNAQPMITIHADDHGLGELLRQLNLQLANTEEHLRVAVPEFPIHILGQQYAVGQWIAIVDSRFSFPHGVAGYLTYDGQAIPGNYGYMISEEYRQTMIGQFEEVNRAMAGVGDAILSAVQQIFTPELLESMAQLARLFEDLKTVPADEQPDPPPLRQRPDSNRLEFQRGRVMAQQFLQGIKPHAGVGRNGKARRGI